MTANKLKWRAFALSHTHWHTHTHVHACCFVSMLWSSTISSLSAAACKLRLSSHQISSIGCCYHCTTSVSTPVFTSPWQHAFSAPPATERSEDGAWLENSHTHQDSGPLFNLLWVWRELNAPSNSDQQTSSREENTWCLKLPSRGRCSSSHSRVSPPQVSLKQSWAAENNGSNGHTMGGQHSSTHTRTHACTHTNPLGHSKT